MRMPADDRARLELDARLDHVLAGNAQVAILELGAFQPGRLRVERARAERCSQTGDDQQLRSPHLPSPLGLKRENHRPDWTPVSAPAGASASHGSCSRLRVPCASGAMANTASLWRVRASLCTPGGASATWKRSGWKSRRSPASMMHSGREEIMKRLIVAVSLLLAGSAFAQGYPNRPIKFVVPFPPGGNLDFVARSIQPKMQEVLGQPVLIDHKGGGAGMIRTA